MTRYEQLCSALREVRERFVRDRVECYALAARLVEGLREFLGVESDNVSFYATQGAFAGRKVDGPAAAMSLADDTFWHFGVAIDVVEEEDQMPCHTIGFEFRLKKVAEHYLLALMPEGPQFKVTHAMAEPDLAALYEHVYQFILRRYRDAYHGYFVAGEPERRFGF